MEADPDPSAPVLINRGGLVRGQTFGFTVNGEEIVAEPIQAGIHPHPEVSFGVLVYAAHPIPFLRGRYRIADETAVLQPRQPAVGSGPNIAVAIFPERADEVV